MNLFGILYIFLSSSLIKTHETIKEHVLDER